MKLEVEESTFELYEPGSYLARCISVIDLGTQRSEYMGEPQVKRQVLIVWETPTVRFTGEYTGPRTISKFYTQSLNEKANLRKDLESWRGKALQDGESVDLKKLLGQPCMLSILVTDKGKNKVAGVMKLPDGSNVGPLENELTYLDIDEHYTLNDLQTAMVGISEGIQGIIKRSDEYKQREANPEGVPEVPVQGAAGLSPEEREQLAAGGQPDDDFDDDIPF